MDPATQAFLLNSVLPAVLAFLVGHSGVLSSLVPSIFPARKATDPVIRPIGQGGIIDLLGQLVTQIAAHPSATPAQKTAALSNLVDVVSSLPKS